MQERGCPQLRIHSTLALYISLRRCLIPVVHDVMLRLLFGDLIVGSRLYFLKALNPTVQQCVRESCVAIETLEHCFFSCPGLNDMWQSLWARWSKAFHAVLSWRLLLFPQPRDIKADWKQQHKTILLLCRVHTAIVFHATWRLRNNIHFEEAATQQPSTQGLMSSFRRHCQYMFQHSEELKLDGDAINSVLQRLGFDTPKPISLPQQGCRIWIPRP
ncbi:hypothetical protein PHYSODRAFT_517263 [Phytophthora sojae]|uniref:Reverse transcriptase zinc-binding domain-containing protein n=1 Tax=Phytophthora sojae (strain P6497) TaxID=1094619 RepID=G4ZXS7_PHYSP|nr:hypothetical protein PHYSODRAFT_517263 [Phytophthora sojae]EGZ11885.1 hypothetical protein PHYSODRAFT_517263 [Phytophthora sojae]|eukprot:XP_009532218.1 hypothetical protein PHYSODRAFT_517263 [Phytophthora sojae]